jgi:hypothetical protein
MQAKSAQVKSQTHQCDFYNNIGMNHKVLTYVEYRAGSGVFQKIDP